MLATYLPYGITEIHTSDAVRCYETVVPMARSLQLDTIYWSELSEYAFEKDKKAAIRVVRKLGLQGVHDRERLVRFQGEIFDQRVLEFEL
jgi:8-oxo-dGTP diphosphatase